MTQSIQVLDQRTQRDLQYVEKMEVQLRGLETKFRQVEETHKQNIAKQYKVKNQLYRTSFLPYLLIVDKPDPFCVLCLKPVTHSTATVEKFEPNYLQTAQIQSFRRCSQTSPYIDTMTNKKRKISKISLGMTHNMFVQTSFET